MKKIFRYMIAAVAGLASLTACTNEPEEGGITPDTTKEYVIVSVTMGEETRGAFTDTEGIKWVVGDQIKYAGGVELTSEALTAEDIEDGGYTANFKFAASLIETDRTGWFVSTKNHPSNYVQVEFTKGQDNGNIYSQSAAGTMDADHLFLHSGTGLTTIEKDIAPTVEMEIAGGIHRVIPYTETYNDESVQWVEIAAHNANGIVGTVSYDHGAGTYKGVNDINYKEYNSLRIKLTEPFALSGVTSRETSKGIYLALAATTEAAPIEGYTYTVKTDVATYTFSTDDNLVVGNNELKNIYLKLENATRVDDTAYKGELQYVGDLNAASQKLSYTGVTAKDGGCWYAQIRPEGEEGWTTIEGAANAHFYTGVTFECIDDATGEEADWLTVYYKADGSSTHWFIDAEPQAEGAAERSATVTATFPDVNGYVVTDACKTKTITVTQAAYSTIKTLTFNPGLGDKTITNEAQSWDHGYLVIFSNGTQLEANMVNNEEAQALYACVEIVCHDYSTGLGAAAPAADWITLAYDQNSEGKYQRAWLEGTAQENTTASQRKVLVGVYMTAPDGYAFEDGTTARKMLHQFFVTQEAGSTGEAEEGLVFTTSVMTDQNVAAAGTTLYLGPTSAKLDGTAIDLSTASPVCDEDWITTRWENTNNYNLQVTVAKNTTTAARTAKVYVEYNGVRSNNYITVNQDAGTGEVEEPENPGEGETSDEYSYTIGGWSQAANNQTKNWSWSNAEQNPVEHWVIVIQNVAKNGVVYTSDMPEEDKKALICYMLNWTSEEYDNAFIDLTVFWGAGETIIKLTHVDENTTGAQRKLSGNIYEADQTTVAVTYEWIQNA